MLATHFLIFFLYLGPLSGTGLEANLFGRMINREESLPNYPDYQILFLSVAHDNFFYDYGLQLNLKESVTIRNFRTIKDILVYVIL